MFEKAVRLKLRFDTPKGRVGVEDLWDLSREDLTTTFKSLNTQLKDAQEDVLFETRSVGNKELALKVDILKHIAATQVTEADATKAAKARREQRQTLLGLKAQKEQNKVANLSEEELDQMIAQLDAEEGATSA